MDDNAVKCIKTHYDNHVSDETRFEVMSLLTFKKLKNFT